MQVKTKNKVVHLRVPPGLHDRIKDLADKRHWTISYYIVHALQEQTKPR